MNMHYSLPLSGGSSSGLKPLEVYSPYSRELIGTVDRSAAEQVESALIVAHSLFRDKPGWLSLEQRVDILATTAQLMEGRFEELATGAAAEGGKPLIDSRVEVARAIEGVKLCIETIRSEVGRVVPMADSASDQRRVAFTQKEPIGVVVAVSAFNHPLNLIVHQVATGIAAGCPTLVKPAGATPLSCHRFVSILHEAGLPSPWCQMLVPETHELTTALVTDPRVGFFSFIGSGRVGWMLRSKLAAGARCALEHGGAAPLIVDESASLEKLVPAILKGGYYHAGQVCVSVQRVIAHRSLVDELTERLAAGVAALNVGDPLLDTTEVGPLITQQEVTRVAEWLSEAGQLGGRIVVGGQALGNGCVQPALILEPPVEAKVTHAELFGPAVCLYGYEDLSAAIAQANSLPFAFQASVFSQDIDRAQHIAHLLDASAVMINDHTAFRQDAMPFAGLRESGLGVGGIPYTIEDMQIDKMTVIKTPR
ncbi:MAG: acyl-CoA reductase-like NAD-dependent aldehyde dehydrogenase [Alcanivorax sp.]|jgi:acyl-CoA reductase-like NAD-dependent aldehyde dehydrogenase